MRTLHNKPVSTSLPTEGFLWIVNKTITYVVITFSRHDLIPSTFITVKV